MTITGPVLKLTQVGVVNNLRGLERTVVKELGKLTPYVRNKGALTFGKGAEKRLWGLFIKNTGLC